MTTLSQIKYRFKKPIKKQFSKEIESYILSNEPQYYINKALTYTLTNNDIKTLYSIGKHKNSKYLHLYWLCVIYIHPFTIAENLIHQINKTPTK